MKKRQRTYLTLLAFLLSVQTGYAQEEAAEVFSMPDVVVTATKTDMDIKEVPSAVQVITQEDIQARGAQTLKDVLRTATGINLVRSSNSATREAISIRGFDSRFSMILIDGKRVSSEIDQNYELDRISLDNIERIEIVRGPVSSLYGTEALGGVVNIITKKSVKPSFTIGSNNGFFSGGRSGKELYNFTYDSGKVGKASFMLSGSYIENNALFKNNGLTYEPFGLRKNFNASVDYELSPQETLTLTTAYVKEDTHEYIKNGAGILVNSWDDNDRDEQSISYNRKTEAGDVFFRYYQSVMHKNLEQRNASTNAITSYTQAKRTIQAYEGRLTKPIGKDHILTIGGEYRPEKFRGTAVNTGEGAFTVVHEGTTYQGSTATLNYLAAYAQDQWTISPKLLAVTSLRYDDSNKFESNLSPKLGLTYKATSNLRLKLNAAQGFRSPTPNQLYSKASTSKGNPDLKSEKSNSYDVSIERDFGKTTTKLTYFINKVDNLIDLVTISGSNKQYQNINKATIQGVEGEITRPLSDKLSWSNSYTYLDAINDATQQKLQNRARHVLTSRLAYDGKDGFTANLWTEAYGDYLLSSSGGEKSYTLWNIVLAKKVSANSKVTLGVDNIFNKKDEDVPLLGTYVHGSVQFTF